MFVFPKIWHSLSMKHPFGCTIRLVFDKSIRVVLSRNWQTWNPEPSLRTFSRFQTQVCSKPNPEIWCDDVTKSSHLYQVPGNQIFGSTKKNLFRNLAASHQTWNVTFYDEKWRHIFSSPFFTQIQVQVLGKLRLGTTLKTLRNIMSTQEQTKHAQPPINRQGTHTKTYLDTESRMQYFYDIIWIEF